MRNIGIVLLLFIMFACIKAKLTHKKIYNKNGIEITLLDVSDSRCPPEVACVWEGAVTAYLQIKKNAQKVDFALSSNNYGAYPIDTTIFNKKIEFVDVTPDKYKETISFNEYEIYIKVSD